MSPSPLPLEALTPFAVATRRRFYFETPRDEHAAARARQLSLPLSEAFHAWLAAPPSEAAYHHRLNAAALYGYAVATCLDADVAASAWTPDAAVATMEGALAAANAAAREDPSLLDAPIGSRTEALRNYHLAASVLLVAKARQDERRELEFTAPLGGSGESEVVSATSVLLDVITAHLRFLA